MGQLVEEQPVGEISKGSHVIYREGQEHEIVAVDGCSALVRIGVLVTCRSVVNGKSLLNGGVRNVQFIRVRRVRSCAKVVSGWRWRCGNGDVNAESRDVGWQLALVAWDEVECDSPGRPLVAWWLGMRLGGSRWTSLALWMKPAWGATALKR